MPFPYKQLETVEKPVHRISRLVDHSVGQTTEPGNNSVPGPADVNGQGGLPAASNPSQQAPDSSSHAPRKVAGDTPKQEANTFGKLEASLPRFGPCYGEDTKAIKTFKDEAWNHVLEKTTDEDESSVPYLYFNAIKRVEKEARRSYDPAIVKPLKKNQFREMMLRDGCFFLQLALYILGCGKQLGYPDRHVYFGARGNDIRKWIKAMFFVGNQIPCVIIHELMKQSFFQTVIRDVIWNPPLDLPRLVLYLVVVHPAIDKNGHGSSGLIFSKLNGEKLPYNLKETPSDLLHCLHTLVLGIGHDPLDSLDRETDEDLDQDLDLESGAEEIDKKNRFPSASEIKQSGIRLRKADGGIRKIHFMKRFLLLGYLYVPPFTFDVDTELMLRYLKSYEVGQQQGKGKREVSAYLRFMRDLIQTQKDVTILENRGIIKVKRPDHKDKLPGMLSKIVSSEEVSFTQNLRLTRLKVTEYRSPPCYLISWALIFTLVQTVFTILQYFEPRG